MRNSLLATAASPFAHLIGRASPAAAPPAPAKPPAAARAEEDEEETDEEKKERERKEANKAAGRAEDDDGEEPKKGKKAKGKKAEGDDESDGDDEGDEDAKAIRARERGRCAAIFKDPAAGQRPDMAAYFAFETSLPREQAIGALRASAGGSAPAAPAGRARMAPAPNPDVGGPAAAAPDMDPMSAAFILAADKRRRGEA